MKIGNMKFASALIILQVFAVVIATKSKWKLFCFIFSYFNSSRPPARVSMSPILIISYFSPPLIRHILMQPRLMCARYRIFQFSDNLIAINFVCITYSPRPKSPPAKTLINWCAAKFYLIVFKLNLCLRMRNAMRCCSYQLLNLIRGHNIEFPTNAPLPTESSDSVLFIHLIELNYFYTSHFSLILKHEHSAANGNTVDCLLIEHERWMARAEKLMVVALLFTLPGWRRKAETIEGAARLRAKAHYSDQK